MQRLALLCGLLFAAFASVHAVADPAPQLDMLQRADGARIVPERFLRSWDPVTVFFESDAGPQGGGPEDAPERFVAMSPQVPGAWQWLGARALQFRPADPWRPLQAIEIDARGAAGGAPARARLLPLLPEPISTDPADGADPIADLDHIVLTFASPIDLDALAKLVSIELRPAPGLSAAGGQFLNAQDFAILPLAPGKRDAGRSYLVQLKNAIPDGRVAILRLKLSNEPGLDEPAFELRLQSAIPFAVTDAACARLDHAEPRRAAALHAVGRRSGGRLRRSEVDQAQPVGRLFVEAGDPRHHAGARRAAHLAAGRSPQCRGRREPSHSVRPLPRRYDL